MFERRLKFFLGCLVLATAVLVARAIQVQLINHDYWTAHALETVHHETLVDTARGRLLDVRNRPIALDVACIDACVDYRAIPKEPDVDWVHDIAVKRAKARGDEYTHPKGTSRKQIVGDETAQVKADIDAMWARLTIEANLTTDEMDDLRLSIVHRVEMRRRYVWYRKFQLAQAAKGLSATEPSSQPAATAVEPWYRKWLQGETDATPDVSPDGAAVDSFDVKVAEQTEPHVIIREISTDVYNRLGKEQERSPGLVLRPSMERHYPWAEAACHVLGRLSRVEAKDLHDDPNVGNALNAYQYNDLIGRGGLEGLCEPLLRGSRGRIESWTGDINTDTTKPENTPSPTRQRIDDSVPGKDVRVTIDIELQKQIEATFNHVNVKRDPADPDIFADMHGAAVVIDIPTGEVRALVSAPTYDLNLFDKLYPTLVGDDLNQPLLNRATQSTLETGSTIKPVVGIGAITQGVMGINETIECTGYLVINGRRMPSGRCWVASKFLGKILSVAHHPIPLDDPHPTGFLTFTDALERSCNVFFENMGDRLGVDGLSHWMRTFGLGRMTGIGITERIGRLPDTVPADAPPWVKSSAKWFGGIGQGFVAATPLQMANVAATIARNGIWMRPRLVSDDVTRQLRDLAYKPPSTQPTAGWRDVPDRVDLHLSPAAFAAAQEGMIRVVNSLAGTGTTLKRNDLLIAGKTGTAQAAPFRVPDYDGDGQKIYEDGRVKLIPLEPSTPENPNVRAPWYLGFGVKGDELKHSWYIGFAPARNPKIAFAVLVEYGGSGGGAAGTIANHIIDACVEHGYVPLDHPADTGVREGGDTTQPH